MICHPDAFQERYRKGGTENIGLELTFDTLKKKFDITYTRSPFKISDNIIFLGEIPRNNAFEAKTTSFQLENGREDFVMDDSALAIVKNDQLVVITGCSHSGICNIIEYAKQVTGIDNVHAVIGGFHLKYNDNQTAETISYFKKLKIERVYPSHCTELPALFAFYNAFNIQQLKSGTILTFN